MGGSPRKAAIVKSATIAILDFDAFPAIGQLHVKARGPWADGRNSLSAPAAPLGGIGSIERSINRDFSEMMDCCTVVTACKIRIN
jgi:hypothetical protein